MSSTIDDTSIKKTEDKQKTKSTHKEHSKGKAQQQSSVDTKYNKLKKKYKHLRIEYSKVLESWDIQAKEIKCLIEERKFLKKKIETLFKSQHFVDEQIFKQQQENFRNHQQQNGVQENANTQGIKGENKVKNSNQSTTNNQMQNKQPTQPLSTTQVNSTNNNNSNAIRKPIQPSGQSSSSTITVNSRIPSMNGGSSVGQQQPTQGTSISNGMSYYPNSSFTGYGSGLNNQQQMRPNGLGSLGSTNNQYQQGLSGTQQYQTNYLSGLSYQFQ